MSKRKAVNSAVDAHIFRKTASRTRSINVAPKNKRGGIRL